ncbi:hypothetical protein Tco_1208752 [Tanacetum coccineum]
MIKSELDNVKEYQISSQSKIHQSKAEDTERVNRKVGEETDSLSDGKVSCLGHVSTNKANLAPKQLSLDKRIEPIEFNLQHLNKGAVSKDEFLDNPWFRNDEFKSGSTEL